MSVKGLAVNDPPQGQSRFPLSATDGQVRPVEPRDIPAIALLQEKLLGKGNAVASPARQKILSSIILDNPWRDEALPSLVYEQKDGTLTGFLGVVPRPMIFNRRKIMASISHTFVVEPGSRSGLAALKLIQTYMGGPQDICIAEGNPLSRKIWEGLGGACPLLYSLCWMRVLQPSQYFAAALKRRNVSRVIANPLLHIGRVVDRTLAGYKGPFRLPVSSLKAEPLDAAQISARSPAFCQGQGLCPDYDEASLAWLLGLLEQKSSSTGLRRILLRDDENRIQGWYIYAMTAAGVWKVIQIMAAHGAEGAVLDHMFLQAREDGAAALYGFMDPRLFGALSARDCVFRHDGKSTWLLAWSSDPAILQSIHEGRAVLSRLDGEWWISFLIE